MLFSYSTSPLDALPATPNKSITLTQLQRIIESGAPDGYDRLPELTRKKIAGLAGADAQLAAEKKRLHWFIASGTCPEGHTDATLIYNSALQLDYDDKTPGGDTRAAELLEICQNQPGVLMAAISPSGHGLKILVATDNPDKEKHREALAAAIQIFAELLDVEPGKFDTLAASQPCYIPYNTPGRPAAYFNPDAEPLALNIQSKATPRYRSAEQNTCPTDKALNAVKYLITSGADVANGYDDYVKLHYACFNAFGRAESEQIAFDLLNNSAAFRASKYSGQFKNRHKSLKERGGGKRATGWTLVGLAAKHGWQYETNSAPVEYLKAEPDEMLLDSLQRTGTDIYGKMIIAGTGTGKTTAICRLAEINQRKTVLIVPTKAIIKQVVKQHANATAFFGGNRLLPNNAGLIITTADSFPALETRINLAEYDVFLDEAHGLANATSPGYKLNALREVMKRQPLARTFGYLTGTPLYHGVAPMLKNIPRIKYEQDGTAAVKKYVEFWHTDNTIATIVELVRRSIKAGRMPAVMLNDKNLRLAALKALTKDIKALIINADEKEHPDFLTLIESGTIPAETQAIICTSVIQMGNSIYDQRSFDFITADMLHAAELAQATARPRKAADIRLYIVRSTKREQSDEEMNAARFFDGEHRAAERMCDELNNPDRRALADETLALRNEMTIRRRIQQDPIKQNADGRVLPCELALMNCTFKAERLAQHANDKLMARALKAYGFTVLGESRAEYGGELARTVREEFSQLTDEQKEIAKAARAEHKETTEKKYYSDLQELAEAPNAEAVLMQADRDSTLTKAQERVKILTGSYCLPIKTAVQLLQNEKTSPQAFTHLCAEISAEMLQKDPEYMALQTMLCIQIKALRRAFDGKRAMTATEIRLELIKVLRLDKSLKLSKYEPDENAAAAVQKANRAALQIIRIFYDVSVAGKPGSRACPRKSVLILNNKAKFHGHRLPEQRDARLQNSYEKALQPAFATEVDEPCPF
jgi:hypothetical protein